MLLRICASVLTGTVLCSIEFVFIVLTNGPFWVDPVIFLKVWFIYCISALAGLCILHFLLTLIPRARQLLCDPVRQYFIYFVLSWFIGGGFLTVLILKDVDYPQHHLIFLLLVLSVSIAVIIIIWKFITEASMITLRSAVLASAFILLANGFYFIIDKRYATAVSARSAGYEGKIPHLCLLVMDTARGDHFSCNGYPFQTTVNMDKIAQEGLLCQHAYSASNWTPPGHISIFTGKYPSQHGNDGAPYMPENLLSLTEVLNQLGYYCMAVYDNPVAGRDVNITQGFDHDYSFFRYSWTYPAPFRLWHRFIQKHTGAKMTFALALRLFEWIQKKGGHLFLYLNIYEPHLPYQIRQPHFSNFTESMNWDEIGNLKQAQKICRVPATTINDTSNFVDFTEASYAYIRAAYDSELAYADHHFGMFSEGMRRRGLLDQTLLVITSDHGEFLGEHCSTGHPELLYNPVLNIPQIFRYPSMIKPTVLEENVSNVDVFPTILGVMGFEDQIPDDVEGTQEGCYSLIEGSFKLMVNDYQKLLKKFPFDTLLLNFERDPEELQDLHLEKQEKCDSMTSYLDEWLMEIRVFMVEESEVSPELRDNLRALGYVQ
jgi:arylsulfatase A-like enzyme